MEWAKQFIANIGWILLGIGFLAVGMMMSDFFTGIGDKLFKKAND